MVTSSQYKGKIFRIILRTLLWMLLIPCALIVLLVAAIQFKGVQTFITSKVTGYLSSKIHSTVRLGEANVSFRGGIVLSELYIEDLQKDTLIYSEKFTVDVDLFRLLSHVVIVRSVEAAHMRLNLHRPANDTVFNYQFIVNAFSGEAKQASPEQDTSSGSWAISLNRISLQNISLAYHDVYGGTVADVFIGDLATTFREFDLEKEIILAKDLKLENSSVAVHLHKSSRPEKSDSSASVKYLLGVDDTQIHNIRIIYSDQVAGSHLKGVVGELSVRSNSVHLGKMEVSAGKLSLKNSQLAYTSSERDTTVKEIVKEVAESDTDPVDWKINLSGLELDRNQLSYENTRAEKAAKGMDLNHLLFSELSLRAERIKIDGEDVSLRMSSMKVKERCGFRITELHGDLYYNERRAGAKNLKLRTGSSDISRLVEAEYSSIDSIAAGTFTVDLDHAKISMEDVYYFAPFLHSDSMLRIAPWEQIHLSARMNGSLKDLQIARFDAKTGNLAATLKGKLRDVTKAELFYAKLQDVKVTGTSGELRKWLPAGTIPKGINVPPSFTVNCEFEGYLKNFDSEVNMYSTVGNINALVKMDPAKGNSDQPYHVKAHTTNFDLGYILGNDPDLGPMTLSVSLDGKGMDTSSIDANIKLDVALFTFKRYRYSDLNLAGHLYKQSFEGKATMRDKNLAFDFDGLANFDQSYSRYKLRFDLKGADLKALHLTETDTRVSTMLSADLLLRPGANPLGSAGVKSLLILKEEHKYRIDSINFASVVVNGSDLMTLNSEKLNAEMSGHFKVSELPASLTHYLNSYFNFQDSSHSAHPSPQDVSLKVDLKDPAFFTTGLVPGLERLSPVTAKGKFNSVDRTMDLEAEVLQARYDGITLDSLNLKMNGDAAQLNYRASVAEISDSTFRFENIFLGGKAADNILGFTFSTAKDDSVKQMLVTGELKKNPGNYELRLKRDMTLNAEAWTVDSTNLLRFGKLPFYASHLNLLREGRSVTVNSVDGAEGSPLEIKFTEFDISTITKLIENKKDLAKGTLHGNIILESQNGHAAFRSDIELRNFEFYSAPIGTVKVKADNYEDVHKYDISLSVEGNSNDISMKGSYNTAVKKNNLDLALDIKNLQMSSVEPFTFGQVKRMDGSVRGLLKIKGEPLNPDINGSLLLSQVHFHPRIIDSYLSVPGGEIVFQSHKIKMSNLVIYDTLGNQASVKGYADIGSLKEPFFDLKVHTQDFLALNTNKKDNPLYYGRIFLNSDIHLTGTMDRPTIDLKAKLNKGSSLTYIKPADQLSKDESAGVVEFTDSLEKQTDIMVRRDSTKAIDAVKGIELNASIDVDKNVDIRMIVDPLAGDSLFLIGGGMLNFSLDRSGKTGLSGKYNISEGGYYLTISEFVKRDFKIGKGSSVTWSGDPLDAYLDVRAVYKIKASPIDLVQDQMAGLSELEANKYRNLLTFFVYLNMTGFMSSPEITFDIELAPEDRGALNGAVNARLAQLKEDETQLNKQVFALLTLKRFVGENPLESSSDGGFASASRSSASKVLTQQLSTLSDRYVNFVDLDLGVNSYEDYSSGQQEGRTQLQVGVSKKIFNDRITIKVGGNVDLEGEKATQNDANDVAGNINIDYSLTEDGRYKLKAFRENQYENPIEGELTKTGAGVVFTRDFNKFKNLFKKPQRRVESTAKK